MLGGPVLLVWCISYPQSVAEFRDVEGIVVAVAGEELIYRLAAVVLIGALCARLAGRNWRDTAQWGTGPAIGGLVGAGLVFSSLPGHVDQSPRIGVREVENADRIRGEHRQRVADDRSETRAPPDPLAIHSPRRLLITWPMTKFHHATTSRMVVTARRLPRCAALCQSAQ